MNLRAIHPFAALALTVAMALGLSGPASATFAICTGGDFDLADNVSPTLGCTILNPLNGNVDDSVGGLPSTYTVNVEQFFSYSNWNFDGKYDNIGPGQASGTDGSPLFDFTGGGQSGNFSRVGALGSISDVMFVFKGGDDTNLVGYLIDLVTLGAGSGTYASPFESQPFTASNGNPDIRDISHISVYYRAGAQPPQAIPEPATLGILGLALLGLACVRRRAKL